MNNENDRWAKEVKGILDDLSSENKNASKNISELSKGLGDLQNSLKDEIDARKEADKIISSKIDKKMITLQTLGYVITTIIIGGGGTLLLGGLTGLITIAIK